MELLRPKRRTLKFRARSLPGLSASQRHRKKYSRENIFRALGVAISKSERFLARNFSELGAWSSAETKVFAREQFQSPGSTPSAKTKDCSRATLRSLRDAISKPTLCKRHRHPRVRIGPTGPPPGVRWGATQHGTVLVVVVGCRYGPDDTGHSGHSCKLG